MFVTAFENRVAPNDGGVPECNMGVGFVDRLKGLRPIIIRARIGALD
jgi:hypothetical protein